MMDEFYNEERINKGGYMLDLYRVIRNDRRPN